MRLQKRRGILADRFALGRKFARQRNDVRSAIAQRRESHGHNVDSIKEVAPKCARREQRVEIAAGRCDDARRKRHVLTAAEARELAVLKDAKKLGLQSRRQRVDVVEINGAAFGQLETANASRHRVGECPALVAKELALEKIGRNRRAVDMDEGLAAPRTAGVNGFGEITFAGARFAANQDRDVVVEHFLDGLQDVPHRRRPRAEVIRKTRITTSS